MYVDRNTTAGSTLVPPTGARGFAQHKNTAGDVEQFGQACGAERKLVACRNSCKRKNTVRYTVGLCFSILPYGAEDKNLRSNAQTGCCLDCFARTEIIARKAFF